MINAFFLCKNDRFFRALEFLLNNDGIGIAGTSKDPHTAVERFIKSKADLVVMDANWSGDYNISGKQILQNFLSYDKNIKVIFVTLHYEPRQIEDIKAMGAKGYIFRNVNKFEKITGCIKSVFSGAAVYASDFAE